MTMPAAPAPRGFDPSHPNFDAFRSVTGLPGEAEQQAVLTRFAADNGLTYRAWSQTSAYTGCIFVSQNTGSVSFVRDHLSTTSGRFVDLGNFEPSAGLTTGPDGVVAPAPPGFMWGFVALQMDRQLPNIMLVSKHRPPGSPALPFTPDPSQALGLEGNFDDYFTLYCPKEFEEDALYVLTPDLMVLLMDEVAPFDVEFVDKWMFIYSARSFSPLDENVYRRIFQILDNLGTKIVRQTGLFNDAALAPAPIAVSATGWRFVPNAALFGDHSPTGTRLKPKSQWPGLVLALVVLALFIAVIVVIANVTSGTVRIP